MNGKNVDMAFLKLIAIHDTIKIDNMTKKASYVASSPAQKIMIQGWVQVEIKKSVFKDLWKIQKAITLGGRKKAINSNRISTLLECLQFYLEATIASFILLSASCSGSTFSPCFTIERASFSFPILVLNRASV